MEQLDSFCRAHTLAYSFLALQEMNLAYKYPIIFWNCACLINDAGGNMTEDVEEEENVYEEVEYTDDIETFGADDEDDDEDYVPPADPPNEKKKKNHLKKEK